MHSELSKISRFAFSLSVVLAACAPEEVAPNTKQNPMQIPVVAGTTAQSGAGLGAAATGSVGVGVGVAGTGGLLPTAPVGQPMAGRPPGVIPPAAGIGGGNASPLPAAGTAALPPAPVVPAAPPAGPAVPPGPTQTLPAVTDYSRPGPFPTVTSTGSGPDMMFTMVRPTTLGDNGFKHPLLTWGNGITTTPAFYPTLLSTIASHGFVIIASDSSAVTSQMMTAGLDWLIQQNTAAGSPLNGKLDTTRAVAMGYSLGGGAALTVAAHKSVIATIAMHPAPGFGGGAHSPVLLFAGTADAVCAPALVESAYASVKPPAFYALLEGADHLEPVLTGGRELAASVAWLRLWTYGDEGGKNFFYGDSCTLCTAPWTKKTNAAWK